MQPKIKNSYWYHVTVLFAPYQSIQVGACSSGGFLFRSVGAERPPVAPGLFGRAFGPCWSWPGVSTALEHLRYTAIEVLRLRLRRFFYVVSRKLYILELICDFVEFLLTTPKE